MKPLVYAPEALADLREIAIYIAVDNRDRAISFVAELEQRAEAARARPSSFRERRDIAPGLRVIGHGRYLILFRDLPDQVRVVRVVHSARNLRTLLDPAQ